MNSNTKLTYCFTDIREFVLDNTKRVGNIDKVVPNVRFQ